MAHFLVAKFSKLGLFKHAIDKLKDRVYILNN